MFCKEVNEKGEVFYLGDWRGTCEWSHSQLDYHKKYDTNWNPSKNCRYFENFDWIFRSQWS